MTEPDPCDDALCPVCVYRDIALTPMPPAESQPDVLAASGNSDGGDSAVEETE